MLRAVISNSQWHKDLFKNALAIFLEAYILAYICLFSGAPQRCACLLASICENKYTSHPSASLLPVYNILTVQLEFVDNSS